MEILPKFLIIAGMLLIATGFFWIIGSKIGINFGKLPGDILIERENFSFYFPINTTIIISVILSMLIFIIFRLFK